AARVTAFYASASCSADPGPRTITDYENLVRAYKGTGPEIPAGAHCRWFGLYGAPGAGWNEEHVARFCFRDGALVEKLEYVARG
ncbi:hypothetical protein ACFWP2_14595, partial [Kitasatospora sp. NPDC058444]